MDNLKKLPAEAIKDYEPYANGVAALHVPKTGIVNYKVISAAYANIFSKRWGGEIYLNHKVTGIKSKLGHCEVITPSKTFETRMMINTAGLYSDKVANMAGIPIDVRIIPFRGEYYDVVKTKQFLVKNLIYPVPDPAFPFLGVHFTRRIDGGIDAGPNAVFAFKREGYKKTDFSFSETLDSLSWRGFQKVMFKYWKIGLGEYYRSFNKAEFARSLKSLVPSIEKEDLMQGGAGVRAQACTRDGLLINDFVIYERPSMIHVLNTPSPAATSSLSIGKTILQLIEKNIRL